MDKLIIGCGYLGRRVAEKWLANGDRVFASSRSAERAEELRKLGVVPIRADVLEPDSLRSLPAAATVLYCVGYDRRAGRSMREVYVNGLAAFQQARVPPPQRFLWVGSTGVYGQMQGEAVDETAVTEPVEESGQVVLAAEELLREREDWRRATVILRFAGIYGPGRLIRSQSVKAGEPLVGDPDKWLNLIHVEDGAAAVVAAETAAQGGQVYNVSDGAPVRRREFYAYLAQVLGAPEPRWSPPPPGAPLPAHERTNRRIVNHRLRNELTVRLRYPSYREGLAASLG